MDNDFRASVLAELKPMRSVKVGGVFLSTDSRAELARRCVSDCLQARKIDKNSAPKLVFSLNGQALALWHSNRLYREHMEQADIVHADGGFLVTISKWFCREPISERSATTDMIHDLANACSKAKLSFYLLGSTPDVNKRCVDELRRQYPDLEIVGAEDGYFDDPEEVFSRINSVKPDVLWVGMGKPREQHFAIQAKRSLECGWIVTCGGCFNFVAGDYKRAPMWMQKSNLEWVHRLATRPRSLLLRYLWTTPYALALSILFSSKEVR